MDTAFELRETYSSAQIRCENTVGIVFGLCPKAAVHLGVHGAEGRRIRVGILAEVNAAAGIDHHCVEAAQQSWSAVMVLVLMPMIAPSDR